MVRQTFTTENTESTEILFLVFPARFVVSVVRERQEDYVLL